MRLILGDCLDELRAITDESIDVIFTSPPYAERRKHVYGGIPEKDYVDWFLPIGRELKRVLSRRGSFFLNIKPHTRNGERSLYVFELVCQLKKDVGFMFVDEFCWTKQAYPGKFAGRFKNGFEPIYHFTKNAPTNITFNPLACGTPMKEESRHRAHRKQCGDTENGSGMGGINLSNMRRIKIARPSNVVNVNNVSNQHMKKSLHPATFPVGLVDFFVKSFSNEGDTVLDPFMGSGTTGISCVRLNRRFIGIEINPEYYALACERIKELEV